MTRRDYFQLLGAGSALAAAAGSTSAATAGDSVQAADGFAAVDDRYCIYHETATFSGPGCDPLIPAAERGWDRSIELAWREPRQPPAR
jgi:hypothetical protein